VFYECADDLSLLVFVKMFLAELRRVGVTILNTEVYIGVMVNGFERHIGLQAIPDLSMTTGGGESGRAKLPTLFRIIYLQNFQYMVRFPMTDCCLDNCCKHGAASVTG